MAGLRFLAAYLGVLALMVGWWVLLQLASRISPVLTVVVAFASLAVAWVVVAGIPSQLGGGGGDDNLE
ncbi:MAG: hypothetical protein ACE5MI_08960 [Acidimicrobiia bacterium]